MTAHQFIPAAQYLRMSTEHQQYSFENQTAAIRQYADDHGIEIVQTYHDAAKSGITLRRRTGLQQLLVDVVGETRLYRAILVYDVSRWGRFQDTDESAHYEFLCKSAGVPVHYCAETFANDGSLPSLIMKAIKRTMAGEYSRELGTKVLAGQKRLASLGFKQGGLPGYGLRRMLISQAGVPKQELVSGERKSIATDRVVLVPGPSNEVECVRDRGNRLSIRSRNSESEERHDMGWMNAIGGILQKYTNSDPSQASQEAHQHFDAVAQAVPQNVLAQGIAAAFNSDQTPAFGQMMASLFNQSTPEQKAGMLSQLLASAGPSVTALLASKGLSGLVNSAGQINPQAASQISPDVIAEMATQAQKQNPSIVDTVSGFYAQHPTLVKTLGAAALSIAMARISRHS